MASYQAALGKVKAIFEEIELAGFFEHAYSEKNLLKSGRNWLTWLKLNTYLADLLKSFTVCTMVSEKEKKLFIDTFP
jgi:hypothetical protein